MIVADTIFPGPAVAADVPDLARLVQSGAPQTIPASEAELRSSLSEFEVLRHPTRGVVAAARVKPLDDHRSELRSVVVHPALSGRGLGTRVVRRAIDRSLRDNRWLTCVTLEPGFFERLGFVEIPLDSLPPKPGRAGEVEGRRRVAMVWTRVHAAAA